MLYVRTLSRRAPTTILVVMVLTGLAAGVWYAARPPQLTAQTATSVIDIQADPVANIQGLTDQGASIPLFHVKFLTPESGVQQFIKDLEAQQPDVARFKTWDLSAIATAGYLREANSRSRDFEVQAILNDNGYAEVDKPMDGDLIVYWNEEGIAHSGIVRGVDERGQVLIESKWGPFGLYEHAPENQPYSDSFHYFHTTRGTHLLKFHWQAWITRASR